ncbi:MAG: tetratricopeptide repeat protein [Magnetococcales bacterium]|nr:tetratricopeptide repeat protein [Magnetococcales bacterium]
MTLYDLVSLADQLLRDGRGGEALELYLGWLGRQGDHPLAHMVWFNLGSVRLTLGDPAGAREALEEAIRLQPDFYASYINLGNACERSGAPVEAVAAWQRLVVRLPTVTGENIAYLTSALKQIARLGSSDQADAAMRQSLEIDPHQHEVMMHWLNGRQGMCRWPVIEPFARCDRKRLQESFAPLSLAAYTDDPMWQLTNAWHYQRLTVGQPERHFLDRHEALRLAPGSRPRVGYLSSDLRGHAIGYLMVELFERHDRERVEVFVYDIGHGDNHPLIRGRIRNAVEHWRDLHGTSDEEAAAQILADRIEILIDVNGYTNSARTRMLAMRPAPVIVNWLGYPGSMGTPYHHYLIADPFLIPEELEVFYSERVVRLPCYQANDRQRVVDPRQPTRAEVGLPEGAMVYGCFNEFKKITPLTWRLWMEILRQVPGSVLWLLSENATLIEKFRGLAAQAGVDPDRLIFSPRLPNHSHLARYPLLDLMLDCTPYGAHTTASDALWMGVPILTLAGLSFPARVCGSLVSAAGLPELVRATPEAFVAQAVALGHDRAALEGYRQRLREGRDTCVLFDTTLLAARLEDLFDLMLRDFREGRLPRPDLTNMGLYREIGMELDQEGMWFGARANLEAAYLEKLIERDRLCYISGDGRLWQASSREAAARRGLGFHDRLVALEDAGDLEGMLALVQRSGQDFREMARALGLLLEGERWLAAYLVAMLLANNGILDLEGRIALCVGGVAFGNPYEVERGAGALPGQMAALSAGERADLARRIVVPAVRVLRSGRFVQASPERSNPVVALLEAAIS